MRKLHSQIGLPSVCPLGFPDFDFPCKWPGCGSRPHQRVCEDLWGASPPAWSSPNWSPSKEACFPSSVSWSIDNPTYMMVLWLQGRRQEPVSAEDCGPRNLHRSKDIPQAISYDQPLGCWRIVITLILSYLLKVPTPSRLQIVEPLTVIRSIGSRWSRWSSKLPLRRPPGLDSLIANRVARETKCYDGLLTRNASAKTGRDGKQSVKRMTRGKNINQSSPRRHSGNTIRVVNLTKLLTHSASIARKKTL